MEITVHIDTDQIMCLYEHVLYVDVCECEGINTSALCFMASEPVGSTENANHVSSSLPPTLLRSKEPRVKRQKEKRM